MINKPRRGSSPRYTVPGVGAYLLQALTFLLGSAAFCMMSVGGGLIPDPVPSAFYRAFLEAILISFLFFLASASLWGVVAAPLIAAFLGLQVSATSLSQFSAGGWLPAIVSVGLPAVLSLPCYLQLGVDAFRSSLALLHRQPRFGSFSRSNVFIKHFFLFLPLFMASAAIETEFMPFVSGLMID